MNFIYATLATYSIALMFSSYDGPGNIFEKLRSIKWLKSFGLLECYICFTSWVALPISVYLYNGLAIVLMAFAISGAAIVLYKITEAIDAL